MNSGRVRNADEFLQRYRQLQSDWRGRCAPQIAEIRTKLTEGIEEVEKANIEEVLLEAHLRVGLIDAFLEALNWHLEGSLHNLVAEAAVRSSKEGTIRFLDYLGHERKSCLPLLIVETKRPSSTLPFPNDYPTPMTHLTAPADLRVRIAQCIGKGLGGDKMPGEWGEWLETLRDYCVSTKDKMGAFPKRVLLTNGDWYVLFLDPEDAFRPDGGRKVSSILVYENPAAVEQNAADVYSFLDHHRVLGQLPLLSVAEAPFYISGTDVVKAAHGLRLRYFAEPTLCGEPVPGLRVAPVVILFTAHGERAVIRNGPSEERIPEREQDISAHLQRIQKAAQDLMARTVAALDLSMGASAVEDVLALENPTANTPVNEDGHGDIFLMITGTSSHYLHIAPSVQGCPHHKWESCYRGGVAAHDRPILVQSTTPKSFFLDGDIHHCAHREVREAKASPRTPAQPLAFCLVCGFEELLCCRTCCFQELCMSDKRFRLPCPGGT